MTVQPTSSSTDVELFDERLHDHPSHHHEMPGPCASRSAEVVTASTSLSSPLLHPMEESKQEKKQKTILVVVASCSIFAFAGSFYGWGPMQLLLEQNGNFGTECITDDEIHTVCTEQTAALLNCRFVSQLTVLTGPLLGYLSDRCGGTTLTYLMGISTFSGLALLMAAVRFPGTVWDSILYLAFILMGLGSTAGGLLTVETGLLFRDQTGGTTSRAQSRVISLLNALFDAGAMTYLALWGLETVTSQDNVSSNANLIYILGGYLGVAVLCLTSYAWFFRQVARNESHYEDSIEERGDTSIKKINVSETLQGDGMDMGHQTAPGSATAMSSNDDVAVVDQTAPDIVCANLSPNQKLSRLSSPFDGVDENNQEDDVDQIHSDFSNSSFAGRVSSTAAATYIPISQRNVVEQLRSQAYVLLCVLFSFHMVSNVWTLTTARDFLKHLGDDDYGNRYLSIFTLMTPVSLIALPFEDVAIHKFGFAWALQGVNFLGILHGIVKVASTNLNVQILGFVIFSFFRCFLFAVTFSCLASFTSSNATGRAVGIMYVVSGAASFVNIGLANLAVEQMNGDFFVPNLIFVVLTIPMVYVVHIIGSVLERDNLSKAEPEAQSLVPTPDETDFGRASTDKSTNP
ncbi:major facilitator superfamily transporter [Nitzschia inconspicua]|uniref:Major facilitator superfamily transporter n=1 Tax=Nitzschia inconspicua TaxID=303405 RepID=A0A9K3L4J6_9STRA|nr:major facilitator superfamily transporter [Nitzschia inconspicua]